LLAQYRDATTYFVHRDHLGSTRILTKLDKTAFDSIDFLPFGEQIAGGAGTTHKFTDKERDPESGLDYFGARYYSSAMGRFATPDWADKPTTVPYSELSDPQSLNLYSYVRNRPTAFVDDDGHDDVAAPSCGGTNKCTETVVPDTPTSQDGVDSLGNPTLVVTNSETVQTTTMNNDGTSTVEWARVTTTVTIGSDGSETATQQVTGKYTATFDSSGTPLSVSAPQSGDVKAISPQEANKSFPGGFDRAVGVAGAAKQLREARENARRTEDIKKTVREEGKSGREHLTWETIAHIVISTCIEFCRW
jgi:RHS repeat-associated protein